jgi:hypothetical protein
VSKKEIRGALEDWAWCKKQGFLLKKQKPTRMHVSLNPRKLKEIYLIIK